MKLRIISLLLVVAMMFLLIPAPMAGAVAITPAEIKQQIRTAYLQALRGSGKSSFHGYCGSLVSWQTYSLGIDKKVYACNGNDQYDMYVNMGKTTGGYSVKGYPASKYTLLGALNAVSHNGTQDVYNLVVGFQKTNTTAGQRYGHALLVHAIIDGIVYFVEGFDSHVAGKFYAEGQPITCTIEEFAVYYDRWTVFDGIAYLGLKTYADLCTSYSTSMKAMATADGYIYEEPGDPGIHEPEAVEKLHSGQWLNVTALLKTPNGKFWYQVEIGRYTRYVEAEKLTMGSVDTSGLTLSGLKAPGALRQGLGFTMGGTVQSQDSKIRSVQVDVYSTVGGKALAFSSIMEVNGKSVSLSKSQFNNALSFRKLTAGSYILELSVNLEINVFENGKSVTRIKSVDLWNGWFKVVPDSASYPVVKFDGNGGTPKFNQGVVVKNQAIGQLPSAQRSGYAFLGWTLDKAGTQPVTEETVITKNTTLYAQWTEGHSGNGGWQETADGWHFCAGDSPVEGWFQFGDLQFYQHSDGTLAKGWVMIDGSLRFFNAAGAFITRLDSHSGVNFEAQTDGKGTLGWLVSGNAPQGPVQSAPADVEKMPAAGRAMQMISSTVYYLAVRLTSGELPEQIKALTE